MPDKAEVKLKTRDGAPTLGPPTLSSGKQTTECVDQSKKKKKKVNKPAVVRINRLMAWRRGR